MGELQVGVDWECGKCDTVQDVTISRNVRMNGKTPTL